MISKQVESCFKKGKLGKKWADFILGVGKFWRSTDNGIKENMSCRNKCGNCAGGEK